MTIEKETPRTKERRSVAEKRLEYLEKRTPTPPSVPKPADIIQIPRHSPDSLIEVNLEVKTLLLDRFEPSTIQAKSKSFLDIQMPNSERSSSNRKR